MPHRPQHAPPGLKRREQIAALGRQPRVKNPQKEARKRAKRAALNIRKEKEYFQPGRFHICRFCAHQRPIQKLRTVTKTDEHGVPLIDAEGRVQTTKKLLPLANFAHLEIALTGGGKFTLNGCADCLRKIPQRDEDGDVLEILMEEDSEGRLYIEAAQDFVPVPGKFKVLSLGELLNAR